MNTKGIKFLAVLAILAMAFAAFAIITTSDDSDAVISSPAKYKYALQGPLDFSATGLEEDGSAYDNVTLGNNILVSYDEENKKYTITGTLKYQTAGGTSSGFGKLWQDNTEFHYGLAFAAVKGTSDFTVKVGNGDVSGNKSATEGCLLYIKEAKTSSVVLTGTYEGTYIVDFSGVTLAASDATAFTAYVALANTNALQSIYTNDDEAKNLSGTDGAGGSWSYSEAASSVDATLTFNNYKGKEIFVVSGRNLTVNFAGTNTIDVALYDGKTVYGNARNESPALGSILAPTSNTFKASAANSSLTINATDSGLIGEHDWYEGLGDGMIVIGDNGESAPVTTISVSAPWSAIRASSGLTVYNSNLTVSGGEKGVNVNGAVVVNKSKIVATLGDEFNNDMGENNFTGFKFDTSATSFTMDATSTINTQGLDIRNALSMTSNLGIVTVSGDLLAKYYVENALIVYNSKPTDKDAGFILITDDANVYGKVTVLNAGSKTVEESKPIAESEVNTDEKKANVVASINSTLAEATVEKVAVEISAGAIDLGVTAIDVTGTKTVELLVTGEATLTANLNVGTDQTLKLNAVRGNFEITKGSTVIVINEWTAGTIEVGDGDTVKISGEVDGNVSFAIAGDSPTKSAKFIVEVEKPLTVIGENKLTFPEGSAITIEGVVVGNIVNNGKITVATGGDITLATITGTGEVVSGSDSGDMDDVTISGQSSTGIIFYPANQLVTVNGTWTLVKGAAVTIKGQLDVPADSKIVIESGASLSFTNGAVFNMDGTLVIEAEDTDKGVAEATVYADFAEMNIAGTVSISGAVQIDAISAGQKAIFTVMEGSAVTVTADGTIIVEENAVFEIEAGASFKVNGAMDAEAIDNYGTIIIDSSVALAGNTTIYQLASDAVVDIKKLTIGYEVTPKTLTITDSGLVFYSKTVNKVTTSYYVGQAEGWARATQPNQLTISVTGLAANYVAVISGITVDEKVTSRAPMKTDGSENGYIAATDKVYTNTMNIAGTVAISPTYVGTGVEGEKPGVGVTLTLDAKKAGKVIADASLVLGQYVTLVNATTSNLTVAGTIDATAKSSTIGAAKAVITNNATTGKITLDGSGLVKYHDTIANKVNAALIETGSTDKVRNYMTIDAAIEMLNTDSSVSAVSVLGSNTVSKTATVPTDATITLAAGSTVNIGKSTKTDIVLTIAKDATLKGNGAITVYGTLIAEQKTDVKGNTITSDVKTEEIDITGKVVKNGWAKWTNVTIALNEAVLGEMVTITKEGDITISNNLEVKAGVILVTSETGRLVLDKGVTLTVNGELIVLTNIVTADDVTFALKATNTLGACTASIVVNGMLLLPEGTANTYNIEGKTALIGAEQGAPIAGAYYSATYDKVGYEVISPLDVALYEIDNITSNIRVNGMIIAKDLAFVATDDCEKIIIAAPVGAGATLIETSLTVGTLDLDGAAIEINANSFFTGTVSVGDSFVTLKTVKAATIADKDGKLTISGNVVVKDKDSLFIVTAGTAYAGDAFNYDGIVGAVDGVDDVYFTIAEGATFEVGILGATADFVLVNGTLSVPNEKGITVEKDLTVLGALDVADATSSKGKGNISADKWFNVGTTYGAYTANVAGTASISGPISLGGAAYIVIAAGTTLDDAAKESLEGFTYSMAVYVEDALWMTVYTNNVAATISLTEAPISDALLTRWTEDYVTYFNPGNITISAHETLDAVINPYIYDITILTDAGIKSISIDGIIMQSPAEGQNNFVLENQVAGVHTVTYTLKSGYEGTAQLYTSNGTVLKDNKFTASGTEAWDMVIELQLTGTYQQQGGDSPTPEPTPIIVENGDDFGVTQILLIVLVVLIAVLIIVLILRLNRN